MASYGSDSREGEYPDTMDTPLESSPRKMACLPPQSVVFSRIALVICGLAPMNLTRAREQGCANTMV